MSANYSPYYTSEAAGETLNGTMVNDRASGPDAPLTYETAMGPASAVPAPSPGAAPSYDNRNLDEIQVDTQAARKTERPPFKSFTLKADGTFKAEGDQSTLADVMAQLTDLKTMKTAAMARVAQLRQQESSGSPILDALSQIAGGMAANDPTMPGWVRALGATNLQMGPQGIKRERMLEEQKALQYGQAGADLAMQAEKFNYAKGQQALAQQEKVQSNWEQLRSSVNSSAQKGILPDKNYFYKEGFALGKDLTTLESEWANAETLAKNYEAQQIEADKRKTATAIATEAGKAPIKIEVGKTLEEDRQDNRKELIKMREGVANQLVDKRYRSYQDRVLTRLDANRVQELAKVPPKVRENLIATSEMDQFLERMEEFVGPNGKLKGLTGSLQGYISQKLPSALSGEDRQVLQHLFGVEKKRVIDFARAGVRGWAPGEDAIRKVGLLETLGPDAAARVITEIRHQININRTSVVQAYKYAPWDATPELLGGMGSPIYRKAAAGAKEFFTALEGVHQRSLEREGGGAAAPAAPAKPKRPWEK